MAKELNEGKGRKKQTRDNKGRIYLELRSKQFPIKESKNSSTPDKKNSSTPDKKGRDLRHRESSKHGEATLT